LYIDIKRKARIRKKDKKLMKKEKRFLSTIKKIDIGEKEKILRSHLTK
jgi:hypothetical protein